LEVHLGRGDSDAPLHLITGDQGGNYLLTRALLALGER
jgi:hypothetical protein